MSIDRAGMKTQHFANIWKPALAPSCPPLTTPLWKAVLLGSSLYIHDETKQICVILNNNPLSMVICSEIIVQNRKMRLEISLLKSNLYQIKRRRRRKKKCCIQYQMLFFDLQYPYNYVSKLYWCEKRISYLCD